jgi:uridine kinase
MRIAVSGTHRSGKSTLIDELSGLLPTYVTVEKLKELLLDDPYALDVEVLEVEGAPRARAKQVLEHLPGASR